MMCIAYDYSYIIIIGVLFTNRSPYVIIMRITTKIDIQKLNSDITRKGNIANTSLEPLLPSHITNIN
jgi:hypothetical protein